MTASVEGQTEAGEDSGHLLDRLVGDSNKSTIFLNGKSFDALIDSGAMISTICESAARSVSSEILPLDDFGLSITVADGSKLDYIGYI